MCWYCRVTIKGATFSKLQATKGGALNLFQSELVLSDSTFTDITASYGGAIYF